MDYRRLNKLTVFDPEPMPTAEHLFQKLNGDKYFTRTDLSKGYWQISIPEEDIPKTAFVTPDGPYEFLKMPFGMINSAATLKRTMKKLLHGLDTLNFIGMTFWFTPVRGKSISRRFESCLEDY